jgi:hypothetical protein
LFYDFRSGKSYLRLSKHAKILIQYGPELGGLFLPQLPRLLVDQKRLKR